MPFCSNCGAQVQPGDKFCSDCGAALKQAASPQQAQSPPLAAQGSRGQQVGEVVVIAVTGLKKPKSFGRWDTFNLLVTPQRMILVPLTGEAINKAVNEARDKAKGEGKGFWDQWGAQLGTSFRYADRFMGWTYEAVVADNPGSEVLPNDSVETVSLFSDRRGRGGEAVEQVYYKLEIRTRGGFYKFELDGLDEQFQGFHQLFEGRFRTDAGFSGVKINIG
ncbi:MAG: zinc ribbon domain-containing protein [Candidatus Bathyarchaeota archaeon]